MTRSGIEGNPTYIRREVQQELKERTLRYVPGGLAKLVYLSSCRDCNSGQYRHDGLAARFSAPAVHEALSTYHQDLFEELTRASLESWVADAREYFAPMDARTLVVWKQLRPYHVVIPLGVTTLAVQLFLSNLKIALQVLQRERSAVPE